jgi:hypothetical protein
MPYLVAIFCSPIALLIAQRPVAAALNAVIYGVACLLMVRDGLPFSLLSAVVIWAVAFWHAYIVIEKTRRHDRNNRLQRWDYFKFG